MELNIEELDRATGGDQSLGGMLIAGMVGADAAAGGLTGGTVGSATEKTVKAVGAALSGPHKA